MFVAFILVCLPSSDGRPLLQRRRHHSNGHLWPHHLGYARPNTAGCGSRGAEPGGTVGGHESPGGSREHRHGNSGTNDGWLQWQGRNTAVLLIWKSPVFPLSLSEFCSLGHQELSSTSVEVPVVHSGSTVLIVSPPNISSTLTGNRKWINYRWTRVPQGRTFGNNNVRTCFISSNMKRRNSVLLKISIVGLQIRSWRTRKDLTELSFNEECLHSHLRDSRRIPGFRRSVFPAEDANKNTLDACDHSNYEIFRLLMMTWLDKNWLFLKIKNLEFLKILLVITANHSFILQYNFVVFKMWQNFTSLWWKATE